MDQDVRDIIERFVDDERVDVEPLMRALAEPAGREYLCALLALRELVGDRVPAPDTNAVNRARAPFVSRRFLTVAAAIVLASGLLGFGLGHRAARHESAAARAVGAASDDTAATAAPAPTKLIRLEAGVDWHEHAGGN